MYVIKNGQIEAQAPSMSEVKELYLYIQGPLKTEWELAADIEAETSRIAPPPLTAEVSAHWQYQADAETSSYDVDKIHLDTIDGKPIESSTPVTAQMAKTIAEITQEPMKEVIADLKAVEPFDTTRQYQDGDSALFCEKVFTKYQGQWIDPSVIPPAELAQHEAEVALAPKPSAVPSIAAADVFKIAQAGTNVSEVPQAPVESSPVPPSAPTPPVAPTVEAAPASSVELDKRGLPWDARIHSGAKSKLANGNWKLARGVDPVLVTQVEAELYRSRSAPAATPAATPVPPAPTEDAPADFTTLVMRLSEWQAAGRITKEQIAAAVNEHGIASLPLLATRPDLVPQVWSTVLKVLA